MVYVHRDGTLLMHHYSQHIIILGVWYSSGTQEELAHHSAHPAGPLAGPGDHWHDGHPDRDCLLIGRNRAIPVPKSLCATYACVTGMLCFTKLPYVNHNGERAEQSFEPATVTQSRSSVTVPATLDHTAKH